MNIQFTKKAYNDYLNLPLNYKEMVDRTLERLISGGVHIEDGLHLFLFYIFTNTEVSEPI